MGMILLLLLILPNFSAPVSIFGRIEAIAEKSGLVPRAPISYVEESPDLRLRGEREKNLNKGERKSRQIKAGPWYPVPTNYRSISEVPSSPRSATSLTMDSGSLLRRSGSRFGQASLLRSSLGPKTTSASLSIKSIRQRAPGSRVGQPSLLRASLSPGTTSASLSIKDKPSPILRSPLGRSSGSRVGKPSLLRSSLSSSTSSATLKID